MYIPEIPNNSLTDEITQIVELNKKLEDEGYYFDYDPPATAAAQNGRTEFK